MEEPEVNICCNTKQIVSIPIEKNDSEDELESEQVKSDEGRDHRRESFSHRKRRKSFGTGSYDSNYVPPNKKSRYFRRQPSVLPSKFLLGGNINDPLNLNGLGNSDNAETPKSSPLPVPAHRVGEIPIFIPKNPDDPLGLRCSDDIETLQDMIAGVRNFHKHRKNRHRRRSMRNRNDSECSVETEATDTDILDSETGIELEDFVEDPTEDEMEPMELNLFSKVTAKNLGHQVDNEDAKLRPVLFEGTENDCHSPSQPTGSAGIPDEKLHNVEEHIFNTPFANNEIEEKPDDVNDKPTPPRSLLASEYVPMSSSYQPSPFILERIDQDQNSNMEIITLPFESPSLTNYSFPQEHYNEPFSPPPRQAMMKPRRPARITTEPQYLRPEGSSLSAVSQMEPISVRSFYRRLRHRLDPIVSPVIPQPGVRRSRHYNHGHCPGNQKKADGVTKSSTVTGVKSESTCTASGKTNAGGNKYRVKDKIFQYGNYNRYYGYRNGSNIGGGYDIRLRALKREWIEGKDVLDIGCNIGHITLSIARDFNPHRVLGIDIDKHLIEIAKKNIMHYVNRGSNISSVFPQAFSTTYGPIQPLPASGILVLQDEDKKSIPFPYNISFQQENYVLDSDELLECVKEEYDIILCMSLTKWIHLNFGDDGLKRFFRRGFYHLRPGGLYILEPQPWSSYKRKMNLTETISQNSKKIKFFPNEFEDYLLNVIGFASVEHIGTPSHHLKGFQRPLLVFRKGGGVEGAIDFDASSKLPTENDNSAQQGNSHK